MRSTRLASLALLAALVCPLTAAAEATVGNFLQRLAQSKSLQADDGRIAADSLRAAGIAIPYELELSAELTEGTVGEISRALGLNVATSRPENRYSIAQVDRFFASFQVTQALAGRGPIVQPGDAEAARFDPTVKGRGGSRGRRMGRGVAASEPE